MGAVLNGYLASRKVTGGRSRRGCAPATISCYEQKAAALTWVLGANSEVNSLSLEALEAYIATRRRQGVCDATVGKELTVLRASLRRGRRTGKVTLDLERIWPDFLPASEPRKRHLTLDEFGLLLAELRRDRARLVCFLVFTGARDREWQHVEHRHVRLRAALLELPGTKSKRAHRSIPLAQHPLLVGLLAEILQQRTGSPRLFGRWLNRRRDLARACARAGIVRCSFNDLRRTFASWLRQAGVATDRIAHLLGHADARLVERVYGQLAPHDLAGDVGRAFGSLPALPPHVQMSERPELA